jgi:hypothetical protein
LYCLIILFFGHCIVWLSFFLVIVLSDYPFLLGHCIVWLSFFWVIVLQWQTKRIIRQYNDQKKDNQKIQWPKKDNQTIQWPKKRIIKQYNDSPFFGSLYCLIILFFWSLYCLIILFLVIVLSDYPFCLSLYCLIILFFGHCIVWLSQKKDNQTIQWQKKRIIKHYNDQKKG